MCTMESLNPRVRTRSPKFEEVIKAHTPRAARRFWIYANAAKWSCYEISVTLFVDSYELCNETCDTMLVESGLFR